MPFEDWQCLFSRCIWHHNNEIINVTGAHLFGATNRPDKWIKSFPWIHVCRMWVLGCVCVCSKFMCINRMPGNSLVDRFKNCPVVGRDGCPREREWVNKHKSQIHKRWTGMALLMLPPPIMLINFCKTKSQAKYLAASFSALNAFVNKYFPFARDDITFPLLHWQRFYILVPPHDTFIHSRTQTLTRIVQWFNSLVCCRRRRIWMQLTHFFDIINEKPKCTKTIY